MTSVSEFVLNYVVNASWQIAVIAIVAAAGSYLLKNGPARYRHVLWLAALLACVLVPLLTATHPVSTQKSGLQVVSAPANSELGLSRPQLTKRRTRVVKTTFSTGLWLTLGYALFFAWRAARLVRFWRRKEELRRSAKLADLSLETERVARRCRAILRIKSARIAQSNTAKVPYTIGALRPLIVLPEAFCSADEERLLAVIGHEMAHVARRDYLSNLLSELALLPISFHPLVFVIRKQIDRARELACDELVSKQLLPPKLYARSLVWAADVSSRAGSQALMLSMFDARNLEERVMRLTRNRRMLSGPLAKTFVSIMLLALCASAVLLSLFSFELKTEARAVLTQAAPAIVSVVPNIAPPTVNSSPTTIKQQPRVDRSLNAANAQHRAEAACAAGRNSDPDQIPTLIAMLGDDTKTEFLRCWSDGRWSPALEIFKHPSPGEQAAIALASMGRPAFLPLTSQLDSANATVRRNAAWAIGELTNMPAGERDDAVPRLITLLSDTDEWVRMAAGRALGELRNPSAAPALIATLADRDWRVRELAVWALSELKDDRAVAALCNVLLSDVRLEVRSEAANALGEIRSAEALPSLKQALNDPAISAKAQWAISEIEGE